MLKATNLCPECNGQLTHKDGEIVCKKCGLVVEEVFKPENRIPMKETRSPTCSLATDKSLGTVMSKGSLFRVLARDTPPKNIKCPKCGYELKVRAGVVPATQIKTIIETNKAPIITRMDKYGSQLMDRWLNRIVGRKSDLSKIFANELNSEIEEIIENKLKAIGRKAKRYTEVAFLRTWLKMELPNVYALRLALWPEKGRTPEIGEVTRILNQTP